MAMSTLAEPTRPGKKTDRSGGAIPRTTVTPDRDGDASDHNGDASDHDDDASDGGRTGATRVAVAPRGTGDVRRAGSWEYALR
jgi:hypothetical protein